MNSSITLRCFSNSDVAAVQADVLQAVRSMGLEDADCSYTVCFSENPPSYIDLLLTFGDLAKIYSPHIGFAFLLSVLKSGKVLKESLDGWHDVWARVHPAERKRLDVLREVAIKHGELNPRISVGVRVHLETGKVKQLWLMGNGDPTNQAMLLNCLSGSLRKAVKSLQKSGADINLDLHVELETAGFTIYWHNVNPNGEHMASFSVEGLMLGDIQTSMRLQHLAEESLKKFTDGIK